MAVCQHLRWRGVPGLVWFSVPNAARRGLIEAQIMKATGLRAGVGDLILLHTGKFYSLEIKTLTGRATASQVAFMRDVQSAGGTARIVHGIDEALDVLVEWGLLRTATRQRESVAVLTA